MLSALLAGGGALLQMLDSKFGQIDRKWEAPPGTQMAIDNIGMQKRVAGGAAQNMQLGAMRGMNQNANQIGAQMAAKYQDSDTGAAASDYSKAMGADSVLGRRAEAGNFMASQLSDTGKQYNDLNYMRESSMNNGNGLGQLGQNLLGGVGAMQGTMMNGDKLNKSLKGNWLNSLMNGTMGT